MRTEATCCWETEKNSDGGLRMAVYLVLKKPFPLLAGILPGTR